jgi:hypothetical protein
MAQASTSTRARCAGTRKDGQPCGAYALPGGDFCLAHDPARVDEVRAARERGGQGKANAARAGKLIPATLRPVLDGLLAAFADVRKGELDPRTGTALGSIAGAIVKVYQIGALEERVQAMEQYIAAQERGAA